MGRHGDSGHSCSDPPSVQASRAFSCLTKSALASLVLLATTWDASKKLCQSCHSGCSTCVVQLKRLPYMPKAALILGNQRSLRQRVSVLSSLPTRRTSLSSFQTISRLSKIESNQTRELGNSQIHSFISVTPSSKLMTWQHLTKTHQSQFFSPKGPTICYLSKNPKDIVLQWHQSKSLLSL